MTEIVDTLPDPHTLARHTENLALADEIRATPGEWHRYPFGLARPRDLSYRINHGLAVAFPNGFEAKTRDGAVYLRYNPKGPE